MRYSIASLAVIPLLGCWFTDIKCAQDVDCPTGQACIGGSYGGQGICTIKHAIATNDYKLNNDHMIPGTYYKQRFQHSWEGKLYDCWTVLPMAKIGIPGVGSSDRAIGPEYMEGPECDQWKKDSGRCEL